MQLPSLSDGPARILVVDDEECMRDGMREVLIRQGYEVTTAHDGQTALYLLARQAFHLVLLDLKMPLMGGEEVLENIRRRNLGTDVIIVSAHGTIESAVEVIRGGATDFLTKPFVPWQLKQAVGRVISHRRLLEERDRLAAERQSGLWAITTDKTRLKAVINSMSEGVMISETDKSIVMCNPAFTNLLGVMDRCIIGSNLADRPELAQVNLITDQLLAGPSETRSITQEIEVQFDGHHHLRASITKVAGEEGDQLGLVTVVEDITLLREVERKKLDFVHMVTHELKAPLGVVDTQLNVILRGLAGELSEKQRELYGKMKDRVRGVVEMINNLLDLARLEDQRFVQQKRESDLNEIVASGVSLMEPVAEKKGQSLTLKPGPDLPPILVDPDSIKDVVMNLISNAVRYTPEGGAITVCTGLEVGYAYFEVSDTGIGIAPGDQERIFDRFYRVKSERTRHIVGTGLGLPIVKAVVEDHRGLVNVVSAPDQGSTFRVSLPLMV